MIEVMRQFGEQFVKSNISLPTPTLVNMVSLAFHAPSETRCLHCRNAVNSLSEGLINSEIGNEGMVLKRPAQLTTK
jgi:hypothetical protein